MRKIKKKEMEDLKSLRKRKNKVKNKIKRRYNLRKRILKILEGEERGMEIEKRMRRDKKEGLENIIGRGKKKKLIEEEMIGDRENIRIGKWRNIEGRGWIVEIGKKEEKGRENKWIECLINR